MTHNDKNLVIVKNLVKHFPLEKGFLSKFSRKQKVVHAVCGVSLEIKEGELFGLVGETGSGKTTLGRCILRLEEPTSGSIIYNDKDLIKLNKTELRKLRRELQIVFQDPYSSLNPFQTVEKIVGRPLEIHSNLTRIEIRDRVITILQAVGLGEDVLARYPHELSGGQRQRVAIARALVLHPKFIVADEPTSALDVSIQAQILNLIQDLQEKYRFSCLFITHDLSVVRYLCDRIAVMYLGKIVELASADQLFNNPLHPYTRILLSSIPEPDPDIKIASISMEGEAPSPINPPTGCRFHPRCPYVMEMCKKEEPKLLSVSHGHYVACYLESGHS